MTHRPAVPTGEEYEAPLEEIQFALQASGHNRVTSLKQFERFDILTCMELLRTVAECAVPAQKMNDIGGQIGASMGLETEYVLPWNFSKLYQFFEKYGLFGIDCDPNYGGTGAPEPVGLAASEILLSSNKSFAMCVGLTRTLAKTIQLYGTKTQKELYLAKLISGSYSGTMCISEPQAGSDISLIRTRATPLSDGSYSISGTKMWVTFGEHTLNDNIIHLVLARRPGGPDGKEELAAFIVPKFLEFEERNSVDHVRSEMKMGSEASPTCELYFHNAKGWLLGEISEGMAPMFEMMNLARVQVGLEGVALSEAAYQTALTYCKERKQGRAFNSQGPGPDNILVHPDVRRMLLDQKSTIEPLRVLCYYIGTQITISQFHPNPDTRQVAKDIADLLTPVCKSYGSERGFWNISEAMQACGGMGYTRALPIERHLRDERVAMIYEGTNGIQALDLIKRKVGKDGGRLFINYIASVTALVRKLSSGPFKSELMPFLMRFKEGQEALMQVTTYLAENKFKPQENVAAIAPSYLKLFALVSLGHMWLRILKTALEKEHFLRHGKLMTARYFFDHIYPKTSYYASRCTEANLSSLLNFDPECF